MKSNVLKSEMGVVVKAKLCRGFKFKKTFGKKSFRYLSKINFGQENFSQKLLPSPKKLKKRLSTYFLHIFFVKLNFIQKHKTLSPKSFLQFESQISCVLAPKPDFYKKLIASMPQKSENMSFIF